MRNTHRGTRNRRRLGGAVLALLVAASFGPLSGTALAAPAPSVTPAPSEPPAATSLFAPSALTLTVARGERAETTVPLRAVTLSCRPTATGTHPAPAAACGQLRAAQGDFDALPGRGRSVCTKIYDPVVVTAEGVWEGERVRYERTYANSCVLRSEGMSVFSF
ncbi:subtilase-type protease inhibitor [Streptomyces daliensis]